MSRKEVIKKQFPLPDPIYNNYLISMLLTRLTKQGKKRLSQKIVTTALNTIAHKSATNPIEIFEQGIRNVRPHVEIKARRIRGTTYQVPIKINSFRGTNLALCWIINGAKKRPGKKIAVKLANELIDASKNSGEAIRKKHAMYKMAKANRAFARYRS